MTTPPPRANRTAVTVAVGLALAWLAVAIPLNVRVAIETGPTGRFGDAWLGLLVFGGAWFLLVGVTAVVAGVVAVGTTRVPGTSRQLRWAARGAFLAALTGPAEVLAIVTFYLILWVLR